jgi:molybdopterin converting factor small subunit
VIKVRAMGVARSLMGAERDIALHEGGTVGELIGLLPKDVRDIAARRELCVMIDGVDSSARQGMATPLHDGSVVILIPFAHGGSMF